MTKSDAPPFEITAGDDGAWHGSNGRVAVSVHPDGVCQMKKRNAIKGVGTATPRWVQWLWAELDGVRVYVNDDGGHVAIVMTKKDLYP